MSVFSDQNVIFEQEYEAVMARHGVLQTFAVHQVALNIFYHPILKYNIKIQYQSQKISIFQSLLSNTKYQDIPHPQGSHQCCPTEMPQTLSLSLNLGQNDIWA